MRKCGITIESLSAHRVADKLSGAGVEVLGFEREGKNSVTVWVNGKDRAKVFAILQSSCYNVVRVQYRGAEKLFHACIRCVGLIAGCLVFLCSVLFMQSRILRIEVVGSGAYYEREVSEILTRGGTKLFSAAPKDSAALTSEILALPRVSFCSLEMEGGVLTVTVEVSDENALIAGAPLLAPAQGIVEELVVVRGTPLVNVGDSVGFGDTVVGNFAPVGEDGTRDVLVIARVRVCFPVSKEYELEEKQAQAQAFIEFGEITDMNCTPTERGVLVEGTAHAEAALNLN